jgi:hypothetical protein
MGVFLKHRTTANSGAAWRPVVRALIVVALLALPALALGASTRRGGSLAPRASVAACTKKAQLAYTDAPAQGGVGPIMVASANGSGKRTLGQGATPAIAPNGRFVAVARPGHGAALGIYSMCGSLVHRYFSSNDAASTIVWSADSTLLAAVINTKPKVLNNAFDDKLVVIDIATRKVTDVASGFLDYQGGPAFSPTAPYQLVYQGNLHTGVSNLWTYSVGGKSTQITHNVNATYPIWGQKGIVYQRVGNGNNVSAYLARISGTKSTNLMTIKGGWWPVALSSDGTRLAAEDAACGAVWPVSVNLANGHTHAYPMGFETYGINASGTEMLIAGQAVVGCMSKPSVVQVVPFGGGSPDTIATGTNPSWATGAPQPTLGFAGDIATAGDR